jgi:hypothetical protein
MEIYNTNGIINGTKDELIVFDDGSFRYTTHNCDGEEIIHDDCEAYSVGSKGGLRIKYGNGSSFSFKDYSTGEIDKRWEKINDLE